MPARKLVDIVKSLPEGSEVQFAEDENKVDELFYPFLDHYNENIDEYKVDEKDGVTKTRG